MTRFVQKHNGSVRRLKGTIGGSSAWKQHVDDSGWENPGERNERIARIVDQLAAEELSEALNDRLPQRPSRRRTQVATGRGHKQQVRPVASAAPVMEPTRSTRLPPVKAAPRFRVVIGEDRIMRAVALS